MMVITPFASQYITRAGINLRSHLNDITLHVYLYSKSQNYTHFYKIFSECFMDITAIISQQWHGVESDHGTDIIALTSQDAFFCLHVRVFLEQSVNSAPSPCYSPFLLLVSLRQLCWVLPMSLFCCIYSFLCTFYAVGVLHPSLLQLSHSYYLYRVTNVTCAG